MPRSTLRLPLALALSLLLHGAVILAPHVASHRERAKPTPATLEAQLLPAKPAEPLLKDTLAEASEEADRPAPPPYRPGRTPRTPSTETIAQRKLAEHLFYPPQAIARGLEGEVYLLLSLDGDGNVVDVRLASGSGHALLDQAALRAAWAMGRLANVGRREVLLPVVFRLK